jgi:hypothetical protein
VQAAEAAVSKDLGGETVDQVRQELRSGKTFDQIAQEHNTTVQAIQQDVVTAVTPLLDQARQAGTITQDQENMILQAIQSGKGPGFFGIGGPHGGHGPKGQNGGQGDQDGGQTE